MNWPLWIGIGAAIEVVIMLGVIAFAWALRKRNMQNWIGSYYAPTRKPTLEPAPKDLASRIDPQEPIDLYIAVCDHYEPEWGKPSRGASVAKVQRWVRQYPKLFGGFADHEGKPPQHTFFFPEDEYRPEYLDNLRPLVTDGFGDVDVHLHHDDDTPERLRETLERFRVTLFDRHGFLRRDPITGEIVYGFIHGNWALCNSRPDGRWCGVDHEIPILKETGCYADFTMPSAPSDTQTRTINSIYYAADREGRASHDGGRRAAVGVPAREHELLMIQGPLVPDWQRRKFGVLPRIENGDLHAGRPPSLRRLKLWMRANVHLPGRPNELYIKLHTHGCKDGNIDTLLGEETVQFHRDLAEFARSRSNIRVHYVTAWEMACRVRNLTADRTVGSVPLAETSKPVVVGSFAER